MDPSPDPVQAWLDRHRAGGQPPLDDLCRQCEDRVRRLVRRQLHTFPLVVQESQTTEVVNETLLKLMAALDRGTRLSSTLDLERFLARVVRNVLLDMHKAIQRRRHRVGELGNGPVPVPDDDDPVGTDLMVVFHEYVGGLPADEQALFDVFYYQGRTKEDAARRLGLPPSTAQARWVKARFRLLERFGRDLTE